MDPVGRVTDVVGGGGFGLVLRRAAVGISIPVGGCPGALDGRTGALTAGRRERGAASCPCRVPLPVFALWVWGFSAGAFSAWAFPGAVPAGASAGRAFPAWAFPAWARRPAGMLINGMGPATGSGFGAESGLDPGLRPPGSDVFSKDSPFRLIRALPGLSPGGTAA
ncbi:hypothetical protein LOC60_15005 [Arthrobacter sp. zg-Y769]|nr:hypothetical protein [Arthrobacter sp. zg-Y769]